VPEGLVSVVERALAKDPAQRFQDCDAMRVALGEGPRQYSVAAPKRSSLPSAPPGPAEEAVAKSGQWWAAFVPGAMVAFVVWVLGGSMAYDALRRASWGSRGGLALIWGFVVGLAAAGSFGLAASGHTRRYRKPAIVAALAGAAITALMWRAAWNGGEFRQGIGTVTAVIGIFLALTVWTAVWLVAVRPSGATSPALPEDPLAKVSRLLQDRQSWLARLNPLEGMRDRRLSRTRYAVALFGTVAIIMMLEGLFNVRFGGWSKRVVWAHFLLLGGLRLRDVGVPGLAVLLVVPACYMADAIWPWLLFSVVTLVVPGKRPIL
ncbi:MAG: hypothetical protein KJ067_04055, partial [Vicinamibacteria bacterium]|nr:hypothetical protein [Vicinamibacteria bacterium]